MFLLVDFEYWWFKLKKKTMFLFITFKSLLDSYFLIKITYIYLKHISNFLF